jgi:hypothetical protein
MDKNKLFSFGYTLYNKKYSIRPKNKCNSQLKRSQTILYKKVLTFFISNKYH